ncbi:neural Wiskott-Aldrich syndrome protein [Rhipicephalus sanguineus]|uniref:neural Wiskott-Aldrich syndrome protein n=1 Tax=Rhipicephalus sanguineus TaxID=34632 RepID=UPI001894C451|nr:neural Wiskott-Aldrich syndrome protein [Rhipicephalus sanguineus]
MLCRVGPRNFEFRPREPNRPNLDPETEAEKQQDRENLDPQRPGQPQKGAAHHKRLRAGAQLPRQNRNHARGDQRNESPLQRVQHQLQQLQLQQPQLKEEQAQHQQQRAQRHQKERAPAEGHSGTAQQHRATGRHIGTAAEDTAERGNGRTPDGTLRLPCSAHRYATSTSATPLPRPPSSPGANGQPPPYPPLGPSSWPPSLPPPQNQEALQHFSNFLGPRWSHNLPPPHPQAMPLPPSPQQLLLFPCGPPSEPPFSAMPSQPVFLGVLCSDDPSQQWHTPSPHWGHEVESVPSQDYRISERAFSPHTQPAVSL